MPELALVQMRWGVVLEMSCYFILFHFFGHARSIRKFPGQRSNLRHSSNRSHCSDNAGPLIQSTIRELLESLFQKGNHLLLPVILKTEGKMSILGSGKINIGTDKYRV